MVGKPLAEPTRSAIDAAASHHCNMLSFQGRSARLVSPVAVQGKQHGNAVHNLKLPVGNLSQNNIQSLSSGMNLAASLVHAYHVPKGTHWAYRLQSLLQSPSRCPHRYMRVSSTHSAAKCCVFPKHLLTAHTGVVQWTSLEQSRIALLS
jgi:hypothetical protein